MAGTEENEGAVIARDPDTTYHLDTLNSTQWYLVQTNQDHWTGDC